MLILTRKQEEVIMIGDDIEIKVLGVHHGRVKLGIKAPKDVPVHREEIYKLIKASKEAAAELQ